jgi:hypothetical protein
MSKRIGALLVGDKQQLAKTEPTVAGLRNLLAFQLQLERGALRRARRHELRADTGISANPEAARKVAAGYQRDARLARQAQARLRAKLADLTGVSA